LTAARQVGAAHAPAGLHARWREVAEARRGQGVGAALLVQCLHAMRARGYAYAVIGGAGPKAFYEKIVPVMEIPGSSPGIYRGMLR